MAAAKAEMDVDEKGGVPSRRSSTSSADAQPLLRAVHKAVQMLREDVDEAMDAQKAAQRQLLWTMHAQVRKDRAEVSCQLVVQGFQPWTEAANPIESFRVRDQ